MRTGVRYEFFGDGLTAKDIEPVAQAVLANPVIQDIHDRPYLPARFERGRDYELQVNHVELRTLDDEQLQLLSRQAHLFLSLEEMRAIRDYYRREGRDPTDIEIETFAQTWSEHCVHKTLRSTIEYRVDGETEAIPGQSPQQVADRPGHTINADGSITIDNLLGSTIAAATKQLMAKQSEAGDFCISVFKDNAGIVRFDEQDGIAIKVETHNHPSAIEPYGGAATGIGGCIRDLVGTGLAARPIANTDTFAVAPPERDRPLPKGVLHPRRILQQVVAGVRDYGNRMGIATVNGSVYFDESYVGNPLVFAGCVGLIPLRFAFGEARPGDRIIALGGRTGRDGIHGATFSSAELTDTHADEFSHAVQIGNAITQKKMMDVILAARDSEGGPLYHAITDCGAGGFSSAVGEMGEAVGASVQLEQAPLKYRGLSYTEIWISEAQERMVLAVPADCAAQLRRLCDDEDVEMCDLGEFGAADDDGSAELVLRYGDTQVGRMSMAMLHDGIPTPTRQATWAVARQRRADDHEKSPAGGELDIEQTMMKLLAHPNIASKHWIVRQYDHEVQGGSVVKPLVGPFQDGPSDAAVVRPKFASESGVAIGAGMQPGIGEPASPQYALDGDSYWMALASIDEAVRNVVCVGADPSRIALLDNFCWPVCDQPQQLGALVRAAEACYDGALAYGTPFVSGKDSLNNQFTAEDGQVIRIPPTLLITAVGIVGDVSRCVTMDAKAAGNVLLLVGAASPALGGSHYVRVTGDRSGEMQVPRVDLQTAPKTAAIVGRLITAGLIRAAHDCSDGGMLIAAAEMALAGRLGLTLHAPSNEIDAAACWFAETPGRYLLEIEQGHVEQVQAQLAETQLMSTVVGEFVTDRKVTLAGQIDVSLERLYETWRGPLDW